MPRHKCKSIAALQIALGGLPDKMRVEVDPNIRVSAKTVGELRKMTAWSENLVIKTPQEPGSESAVERIEAISDPMRELIEEQWPELVHKLPRGRCAFEGEVILLHRGSPLCAHRHQALVDRPIHAQQLWGTFSGIRTGSLGAGSVGVGVGLGTTTGLGIVSGISIGSEPG
jgi:hypothetical protein